MEAARGREEALAQALQILRQAIQRFDGCESVEILASGQHSGAFVFMERWVNSSAQVAAGQALGKVAFAQVLQQLSNAPRRFEVNDASTENASQGEQGL
jgi:quinol monooxygenase YgiN